MIPFIYSRFDIVWPDTSATSDSRTGVDALTYGLSTLVMSFDVFGGLPSQRNRQPRTGRSLGSIFSRRRAGNDYAKWTRKFSLGNGPAEWVSEYLISKESGKMLGTLVALAIARMERLESFVWDMPTGIVRDVWDALSYLGESQEEGNARLQSIWIRCHDSKSTNSPSSHDAPLHQTQIIIPSHPHGHSHPLPMPSSAPLNTSSNGRDYLAESYRKIEHPNFSILSAMQSITVLEIDEPAYLEELSILVERSAETLRTLRIGAATIWHPRSWATPDTETPSTSTPVVSSMSYLTSGGMLGMVMSKLYDCRKQTRPIVDLSQEEGNPTKHPDEPEPEGIAVPIVPANIALPLSPPMSADSDRNTLEVDHTVVSPTDLSHHDDIPLPPLNVPLETFNNQTLTSEPVAKLPFRNPLNSPTSNHSSAEHLKGRHLSRSKPFDRSNRRKLKLQTLELEKVPLSIQVMQKTIDMRCLTSLTLLNCESDEELWKTLRRTYCPRPNYSASSGDLISAGSEYYLNLKRIHTNNVSSALIGFLKETLAPNTLEWLFLQDRDTPGSKVKIDQIYRGPLRRHRASLKKLMIDSGEKSRIEGSRSRSNTKWEKWVFNREVLAFVTGGKMTSLRELAMSVEYKDWVCIKIACILSALT